MLNEGVITVDAGLEEIVGVKRGCGGAGDDALIRGWVGVVEIGRNPRTLVDAGVVEWVPVCRAGADRLYRGDHCREQQQEALHFV